MTHQSEPATLQEDQQRQLHLVLTTEGGGDAPVYIAGNFNDWQADDERYRLTKVSARSYAFTFSDRSQLPAVLEYKYTRGNWASEELDRYGNPVENRRISTQSMERIEDFVPLWKRDDRIYNPDFYPTIEVISENFEIPQLIKTRRIAALLPHDYHNTEKRYPVLYLQDGQNLFDDYAPFGSWGVDKRLAILAERGLGDLIIISIDHAEEERIAEFTPSATTRLGRGDGKKYVRFLADTLKPYVDKHFRTRPERTHTGIGGSSMGGLISIYAGLIYPEVYGKLLIFSPSLWAAPNIHFHAINFHETLYTRIYIYAGVAESRNMVPNIKRFKAAIEQQQLEARIEFKLSIDPEGQHNEARWGQEFPKAVEWLFFDQDTPQQPIL